MRTRLIRLAAKLYPRIWRGRYAAEFDALLDDADIQWRDLWDVANAAAWARFAANWKPIGSLLGVVAVALAVWGFSNPGYDAQIRLDGSVDDATVQEHSVDAFARFRLMIIINGRGLYLNERQREPVEDVIPRMVDHIQITRMKDGNLELSFHYPDAEKARLAAGTACTASGISTFG